ncbi:MAG: N-acetylmuramoyl-L-alanine amidase [Alphaproteobacteria bacterium]|nr:N-acetylmuramoyl-L-alanine amidase [Alphaproteobacteria bacterium]HPF46545.1 N-acetylmuramoyl-L-alanine amidase [Emcibacteraceae bacterium]HRW28346.1 N-acetylmuramoyl-L-alanine amidase [Emcibacteraceae bacterium]
MKVVKSPNFNDRKSSSIKYIIFHYTGMSTGDEALERLCDPEASVSAHYLIEEDGTVFNMVDEDKRAWHAGVSRWENDVDINDLSIGIEIVNPGHSYPGYAGGYRAFPEMQMDAVKKLSLGIIRRHEISPFYILGHSDVAWRRKIDPGELFDWQGLAKDGIGCWPETAQIDNGEALDSKNFIKNLKIFGYDTDGCEQNISEITAAFQRHFRQSNINGELDFETFYLLESLLKQKIS